MKFNVQYYSKFNTKYYLDKVDKPEITETYTNLFENIDFEQLVEILKDILEPTPEELTIKQIKKDFGKKVTNEIAQNIKTYFDKRTAIYNNAVEVITNVYKNFATLFKNSTNLTCNLPKYKFELTFDIPADANNLNISDTNYNDKQLDAFITIIAFEN